MRVLIKNTKIVDVNSKYNNKIMDVLIVEGKIEKILDILATNKENENKYIIFSLL